MKKQPENSERISGAVASWPTHDHNSLTSAERFTTSQLVLQNLPASNTLHSSRFRKKKTKVTSSQGRDFSSSVLFTDTFLHKASFMETRQVQQIKVAASLGAASPHEYSAGLMRSGKQVAGEGLFGLTLKTMFGTSPEI